MTLETLKTQRTILRRYTENDREIFMEIFTDKEVNFYMGGEHCETKEDAGKLFDKCFEIYKGKFPDRYFEIFGIFGIEYGGRLIGHFELKQTDVTDKDELEVVYLLDKKYWGKGLMPEILNEVNKLACNAGRKLIATINPENTKTMKALEKTGLDKQEWITKGDERIYKVRLKQIIKK